MLRNKTNVTRVITFKLVFPPPKERISPWVRGHLIGQRRLRGSVRGLLLLSLSYTHCGFMWRVLVEFVLLCAVLYYCCTRYYGLL